MAEPEVNADTSARSVRCIVDVPYLIALNIGVSEAPDGSFWADPSWAKDIIRHLAYLPDLTLLGAVPRVATTAGLERLPTHSLRIVPFVRKPGPIAFLWALPRLAAVLVHEVLRARIVHTGIAGYPLPVGWLAVPIARLFRRKIVLIVESAFWRIAPGTRPRLRRRLFSAAAERINRWCMRQADFAAYAHEDYRRSLPSPRAGGGVLFQASWINADQIVAEAEAADRWSARVTADTAPRFLFASRLTPEKGTRVLASAVKLLAARHASIAIDIIGDGPDRELMDALAAEHPAGPIVRLLAPVAYGEAFFTMLRDYDAVLVPILSDEQPRVVYDAGAQAVSTIGSDLPGLRACVPTGTGRLIPANDANALADALLAAAADRVQLRDWAMAARDNAELFTHDRMHEDRCQSLQRLL